MDNTIIYVRVSSTNGSQDFERQINDLKLYAKQNNLKVIKVFAEKVSGITKNEQRTELMNMINYVQSHHIDKVLITELSRLGRSTSEVLKVVEIMNSNKVGLYIHNLNCETLNVDKSINPTTQMLITMMAEMANMERRLIRERMVSGYNNYRNNGGKVGRRIGYKKDKETILNEYKEEIRLLKKNISLRNIQKITGTSINTIRKVKNIMI